MRSPTVQTKSNEQAISSTDLVAGISLQQQIVFTIILGIICATAFGAYTSSITTGFLLDDFSHLDYAYRASQGDWSDLVRVFIGNWTGSVDDLTSFRPFISLSFCLDYLVWGINSAGYHITNLLMFSGCSALTGLIAFELSACMSRSARLVLMAASGLLFAMYPLHPESVAWIIGRVDVQCGLFYFASLYAYILSKPKRLISGEFESKNGTAWKVFSLLAFGCALPSKEMAVTLPFAVIALELLAPAPELNWQPLSVKEKLQSVVPYLVMLAIFAVIRTCALGTLVGGYGDTNIKTALRSLSNFRDQATWCKVLFGVNEEISFNPALIKAAFAAWGVLGALLILRCKETFAYWRTLTFFLLWSALAALPTFQIWHVYPNLCGSRLLFIPSAPLCIAISLVALPAFSLFKRQQLKALNLIPAAAGCLTIGTIAFLWFVALQSNLLPWVTAGDDMKQLTAQVREIAKNVPLGKKALLLDLPQDRAGAGMLGRPEFLQRLLRPPLLADGDYTNRIETAERVIPGSHDFAYPRAMLNTISDPLVSDTYKYDQETHRYKRWTLPDGTQTFTWSASDAVSQKDGIYWLAPCRINPFSVQALSLQLRMNTNDFAADKAPPINLVWRSAQQPQSWIDYSEGPAARLVNGKIVFVPSRYRSWLLNGPVVQIGFKSAVQDVAFRPVRITGDDGKTIMPSLTLVTEAEARYSGLLSAKHMSNDSSLETGLPASAKFDASTVSGASGVRLVATKAGVGLLDIASDVLPPKKKIIWQIDLNERFGSITLPQSILDEPGVHQLEALAINAKGKPIGLASDPCTIRVK